jgi:hypothetical protein
MLMLIVCAAAVIYLVKMTGLALPRWLQTPDSHIRGDASVYLVGFCAAAFPILVFVFAHAFTKTFNGRYALAGAIGLSCLTGCVLSRLSALQRVIGPLLLAACCFAYMGSSQVGGLSTLPLLNQATKPYPSS